MSDSPESASTGTDKKHPRSGIADHARTGQKPPRKPRRRTYTYAIIVAIAAIGAWLMLRPDAEKENDRQDAVFTVIKGDLPITVSESGSVESQKNVEIVCEVEGMSTIVFVVPEGCDVKKGDKLVELDSSDLRDRILQQEITVHSSKAAKINAEESLAITDNTRQSQLKQADLTIDFAALDLRKFLEADRKRDIAKAQMDIDLAERQLALQEDRLQWSEKLAAAGYVTVAELKSDQLLKKRYELSLEDARQAKNVLEEYTHPRMLKKLEVDLEEAKNNRERTDARTASSVSQAKADLDAKQMSLGLTEAKLEKLKAQLEKTIITAPQDGMVVYFQDRWGNREPPEVGKQVRERQGLLTLPNLTCMQVRVEVHESMIGMIQTGIPATIIVDSLPDKVWSGEVKMVAAVPDSQGRWLNSDLKVYSTVVAINAGPDEVKLLRPGMSARVEMLADKVVDTVMVPVQAVTRRGDDSYCYIVGLGSPEKRKVVVGKSSDKFIQIISGLAEGEKVLLYAPALPEAGVSETEAGGKAHPGDDKSAPEKPSEQQQPTPPSASSQPGAGAGGGGAGPVDKANRPPRSDKPPKPQKSGRNRG
ncbi:MAG TPA: efflux RND transporter periplasmic adaptor subunit [Candidatus Brocadiia bacterium]|nr:efflux RND transporter periplasmic adaptor subunit [Candidatus Brocadiia bacterium]